MNSLEVSTLKVTFTNNSNVPDSEVWIGFVHGTADADKEVSIVNLKDQCPIKSVADGFQTFPAAGNWYALTTLLSDGVGIRGFSGRIYVCYGEPWILLNDGYQPGQAVTDPNFYKRYDKMEITFHGQQSDVANLTSIDYWSIPMTLRTLKVRIEVGTVLGLSLKDRIEVGTVLGLLPHVTTQQVFDALNKLTTPPVSGLPAQNQGNARPLPALVPGEYQRDPNGPAPGTAFARIIGPSQYPPAFPPPGGVPVTPYDLLEAYLKYLWDTFGPGTPRDAVVPTLGDGRIAHIAGNFAGVGPEVPATGPQSRQSYKLWATIDADLNITLSGKTKSDTGVTDVTMVYKRDNLLNPDGIYGGNAWYILPPEQSPTKPDNNVYGWIGGDLFSGLNIGAVGSTTVIGGRMVGAMASHEWFTQLDVTQFFSNLQPLARSQPYRFYNQWAETLSGLSQAYNFAYSDRFSTVVVGLDPAKVNTLEIILEDATVNMEHNGSTPASPIEFT